MNSSQNNYDPSKSVSRGLPILLMTAAALVFGLIVLGIIVRVTQTGAACPDWPTCLGDWLPPQGTPALLVYLHRFLSILSGLGILAALAVAWSRHRQIRWIWLPLLLGAVLMGAQILLGRFLMTPDTTPLLSALHLGLALGVFAAVLLSCAIAVSLWRQETGGESGNRSSIWMRFESPFARLSLLTLLAVLVMLASGAWLSTLGRGEVCANWLLCDGKFPPADALAWAHLIHRGATLSAAILMLITLWQAWRSQRSQTGILAATTLAGVLLISQAMMGSKEIADGFPAYLLGLHVATSVAFWGVLVIQVALVGLADRSRAEERADIESLAGRKAGALAKDLLMLTKPVVVLLLLVTTFAGMVVGAQAWPSASLAFWTLLGGAMAAGGSGAINQFIDRYDDTKMQRTARRPIPAGRLTPAEGLAFGIGLAVASFYLMVAFVNFLAALLVLAGIIYYVILYSILLKKTTVQNIVIGGGAGAIPPLVGWAAATGSLNIPSLFLFAVVFMWTPPHFWALALVRRQDYARAGVPMMPVVRGERETRWQIWIYTLELVGLTLVLPIFGLGGGIYLIAAVVLGGLLIYSAWKVRRVEGNKVAWKMYRHSSMYLAFLFLALMIDALI